MLTPQIYNPEKHRVLSPQPPFIGHLQRETPRLDPPLFAYQHMQTKLFVVAGWINKQKHKLVDILNLGKTPEITREQVRDVKFIVDPPAKADSPGGFVDEVTGKTWTTTSTESIDRAQAKLDKDEANEHAEDCEELMDFKRHLMKQAQKHGQGDSGFYADVKDNTLIPQKVGNA